MRYTSVMIYGNEQRTPNPTCPDCQAGRLHSEENCTLYHPLMGHGYSRETGWTYNRDLDKPYNKVDA